MGSKSSKASKSTACFSKRSKDSVEAGVPPQQPPAQPALKDSPRKEKSSEENPPNKETPESPSSPADPLNPFQEPLDSLREEERYYRELSQCTHFQVATLRRLHGIFQAISQSQISDGMIDVHELTSAMGLIPTCLLARGIFRIFDSQQTKAIDFPTWARTLSALSNQAGIDEKIKFSFSLFDINNDGAIDVDELRQLLEAALRENGLNLTDAEIAELCDHSLQHVDRDGNGTVEYSEYAEMVKNSTKFLESFTLDIDRLCGAVHWKAAEEIDEREAERKALAFKNKQKHVQRSDKEEGDEDKGK